MDINELNDLLVINAGGALSLNSKTFPGDLIGSLLSEYNNDSPIVIERAHKVVGASTITVTGTSSLLKVNDVAVTAIFGLDRDQQPTAAITYELIGSLQNSGHWTFGQSFTDLPSIPCALADTNYLNSLLLTKTSYVLSTHDGLKHLTDEPLARGLNFFSDVAPDGLAGIFNSLLGKKPSWRMNGTIHLPISEQVWKPVPYGSFPWQMVPPIPGISLTVPLGVNINLSDKLILDETNLFIYTPSSGKWLEQNNTYRPVIILSGTLKIPALHVSVAMHAYVEVQSDTVTIVGDFNGVSIENLSQLSGLTNGDGLENCLPEALQTQLKKLSLKRCSLSLQKTPNSTGIQFVSVTVGIDSATWEVIPGFTVDGIFGTFVVTSPFKDRKVTFLLSGELVIAGARFLVQMQVPKFAVIAQLEQNTTIALSSLFKKYLPSLPAPPDLTINEMSFYAEPGSNEYDFFVNLADAPAWTINVTPLPLTISNVRLEVSKAKDSFSGTFTGSLAIGDIVDLTATYQTPGDFIVRSVIPSIKLSKLIGLISDIDHSLPEAFDFNFKNNYIIIEKSGDQFSLSCGTNVENFGLFILKVQKNGENWGFGFGMDVKADVLGSLPGLKMLGDFVDYVGLEDILLVASSISESSFDFPDIKAFNQPSLGNKNITLPAQAGGLVKGLNIYARLSGIKSKGFQSLAKYFGIKADGSVGIAISISLPDPVNNSKLYLSILIRPYLNTTISGEFGVLMQGEEIGVFLKAQLKTTIQKQERCFALTALVVENGAFISGSLQGSMPKFSLTDDVSVQLSNLAVEIGIDLEGIPSFGFTGQIDTSQGFDSSIAMFFDSTDPAKSLLAGSISNVSLNLIAQTFSSNVDVPKWLEEAMDNIKVKELSAFTIPVSYSNALDQLDLSSLAKAFKENNITVSTNIQQTLLVVNSPGKIWSLTLMSDQSAITHYQLKKNGNLINVTIEAQLYLAPETTMIGNIQFPQGFKVCGTAQFFFLTLTSDTEIIPSKGIKINEELKKIEWKIGGVDLFKVSGAGGAGNAQLSLCSYTDEKQTDPKLKSPHFLISGDFVFLDIVNCSTFIDISKEGFKFEIQKKHFLVDLNLNGQFTKLDDFGASGYAKCTIGTLDLGRAGAINFDTEVSASFGIAVTHHDELAVNANASFDVKVHDDCFKIIDAKIDIDEKFFQSLPSSLAKLIVGEILKEPLTWLKWVNNDLIKVTEEVAVLLKEVFKISNWKDVASLMREADCEFETIVKEIVHAFCVTAEEVGNYLAGQAKVCAINSVNALTVSYVHVSLHLIAQPALVRLTTSKDGQRLLYLFYDKQDALMSALIAVPSVWKNYVGPDGSLEQLKADPAQVTVMALESLKNSLGKDFETAINEAITILKRYVGLNASEFFHSLEMRK